MNDYAGQRELIAENMMMSICIDLTKYLQELKQERKTVSLLGHLRPVERFCGFTTFIKIVGFGWRSWPCQDQAGTVFHRRNPPEKYPIGAGTLYIFQEPFEASDVMLNISELIPQLSAASVWYVLAIMRKKSSQIRSKEFLLGPCDTTNLIHISAKWTAHPAIKILGAILFLHQK